MSLYSPPPPPLPPSHTAPTLARRKLGGSDGQKDKASTPSKAAEKSRLKAKAKAPAEAEAAADAAADGDAEAGDAAQKKQGPRYILFVGGCAAAVQRAPHDDGSVCPCAQ